jgi:hypothetical protein
MTFNPPRCFRDFIKAQTNDDQKARSEYQCVFKVAVHGLELS